MPTTVCGECLGKDGDHEPDWLRTGSLAGG